MKKFIRHFRWFFIKLFCNESTREFFYNTEILPETQPHLRCRFYNWFYDKEMEGWYILDENGYLIPWVHFDGGIMCCYYDMMTPLDEADE